MPSTWRLTRQLAVLAACTSVAGAFLCVPPARSSAIHAGGSRQDLSSVPRYSTTGATVVRRASDEDDALAKVLSPSAPAAPAARPPPTGPRPGGYTSRPPRPGGPGPNNNFNRRGPPAPVDPDRPPMNEQLLRLVPKEVRCVVANAEDGDQMLGIMPTADALAKAKEMGVDLIMISETAVPPVVKIIDYGKFKYSQEKKKKEQKKRAKTTEVKEVKMSYKIEQHDYGVRLRQMMKFIDEGDRVKVIIQFRGREQQHIDLGQELIQKLNVDMKDQANMEGDVRREGNRLTAMFKPRK